MNVTEDKERQLKREFLDLERKVRDLNQNIKFLDGICIQNNINNYVTLYNSLHM